MNIGYVICEEKMDDYESTGKIVTEHNNRLVAEAVVMVAETVNRNGRFYKYNDVKREFLECDRTAEMLKAGFKGELGHPCDQSLARQQTIDPRNTCVQFLKFWMEGNVVKTHMKGTNNDLGEYLDRDLRDGLLPALSIRALGTIKNTPKGAMVENFKLICPDVVHFPSFKEAYTTKIISESASMDKFENANPSRAQLIPITNEKVINYIKSESCNLNTLFNNFDMLYESIKVINSGKDVQLMDKTGNLFIVNLETYITNEIESYCFSR